MTPIDLTGRTRAIGAPRNWDSAVHGECGVLCVRDDHSGSHPNMTSAWLPSAEDLRCLNLGLPILLTIFGEVHPVVSVAVGQPSDVVLATKIEGGV